MIIHVGSRNRVKIDAVQAALSSYSSFANAQILGVVVDSGVSAQPRSLQETVTGAQNRARNAFPGSMYSVGLEAGMLPLPGIDEIKYFIHTVCAIYDGSETFLGFSPAFPLPQIVASFIIEKGMDLEQACVAAKLTQDEKIGHAEGVIGYLSQGIITRMHYTIPAIQMALIGLQNRELFTRRT